MITLRVNIENERAKSGLSKNDLAEKLGISLKTYYNWLNGETDIPGTKLKEMAALFGVSMEYLIENVSEEKGE